MATNRNGRCIIQDYLEEKFDSLHDKIDGINKRLDTLNGQTAKNTEFRNKQTVVNYILASIGMGAIGIFGYLLKSFIER